MKTKRNDILTVSSQSLIQVIWISGNIIPYDAWMVIKVFDVKWVTVKHISCRSAKNDAIFDQTLKIQFIVLELSHPTEKWCTQLISVFQYCWHCQLFCQLQKSALGKTKCKNTPWSLKHIFCLNRQEVVRYSMTIHRQT